MRYIKPTKQTELEKILIAALASACQPGCSHEDGCAMSTTQKLRDYELGMKEVRKYTKENGGNL